MFIDFFNVKVVVDDFFKEKVIVGTKHCQTSLACPGPGA